MRNSLTLIAFGFGNLAMLGWLAAAATPLLIHLWSRHRFRESPWAAMQFLLAAMRKNARRLHVQQWLLLTVRTLIILLVVLAVAEPYGERLLAGGSAVPMHKILVLDGSYSMAYRANSSTDFDKAKQLAASLVRQSQSTDVFTVILMSSAPKLIVGPGVIDHAEVALQIESLTQPQTVADLASTITRVQESIDEKGVRNLPDRNEVYFFTDVQRGTWGVLANNKRLTSSKRDSGTAAVLESIGQRASLIVIDVGQPNAGNLAITNLAPTDSVIARDRDTGFDATLHQFGQAPRTQCRVEFLVDDVPVGEETVDVAPASDRSIHFVHRFQSPGNHTVTVRASGDRLNVDNSRSLVVPVREEMRVLCVAGREGAAKYLADALNPNPAGDSPIRPVVVSEGDLAELALTDFDCVFLCNVAQLTASEAERLVRYAEAGGGVVIFLGDRVVPSSYNALGKVRMPLLPAHR